MAGWENIHLMLKQEFIQQIAEGKDPSDFDAQYAKCQTDEEAIILFEKLMKNPRLHPDFSYIEPSDYGDIVKASHFQMIIPKTTDDINFDAFYGAWIGRSIGCALGKPLEAGPYFWESTESNPGWKNIVKWFEGAHQFPITDYVPKVSSAQKEYGLYTVCPKSLKENIQFMETDDDIRYTVVGLYILEKYGANFNQYDVGKTWHELLPYQYLCTAETQAYLNFAEKTVHLIHPKDASLSNSEIEYIRTHMNPYREWIGAQIRIDAYAYAMAGSPLEAARLAYQDASFSHVKNGIYGAMFFASVIASAFTCKDIRTCIFQGLEVVPKKSRLYEEILQTIAICDLKLSQLELIEKVWKRALKYSPVHTINNSCFCVASLLYGNGNFEKAVTTAVLFGLDTDCNGATVGSIMGAFVGEKGIDEHWKNPLNDTLYSGIIDFHPIAISKLAARTQNVYHHIHTSSED